jgi:hypothetical protein
MKMHKLIFFILIIVFLIPLPVSAGTLDITLWGVIKSTLGDVMEKFQPRDNYTILIYSVPQGVKYYDVKTNKEFSPVGPYALYLSSAIDYPHEKGTIKAILPGLPNLEIVKKINSRTKTLNFDFRKKYFKTKKIKAKKRKLSSQDTSMKA